MDHLVLFDMLCRRGDFGLSVLEESPSLFLERLRFMADRSKVNAFSKRAFFWFKIISSLLASSVPNSNASSSVSVSYSSALT